jgi:sugar porter (SP) family MFS transporter
MKSIPAYTIFLSIVAALGGMLFGYHTAVISGAILFLEKTFNLSVLQLQLIVSTILLGALLGSIFGGSLADHFGRKRALFLTSFLFLVGTYLLSTANSVFEILVGRFITGIGIGIASLVVPLYIAEIAPTKNRGMLVSFNQFAITIGILIAYLINYRFAEDGNWRFMFGFAFFPAFLQLFGLFFIPDTPSWLISHGKKAKAYAVLAKTRKPRKDEEIFDEKNRSRKEAKFYNLFDPTVKSAFLIGVCISIFQQITGINIVIYYSPRIFQLAGFASAESAILATNTIGIVNVLMTFIALWIIDRVGRRPLLIIGVSGMALSLAVLGGFFALPFNEGIVAIIAVLSYVCFFAISLGPIAWLIISEIFPLRIRGRAMGIAVFSNWFSNYVVSLTFLTLINTFGITNTFWFYALICILVLWFIIKKVPETRGKSFEQIQKFLKKR